MIIREQKILSLLKLIDRIPIDFNITALSEEVPILIGLLEE
jgi:hypothetical protein